MKLSLIKRGSKGGDVKVWQEFLNSLEEPDYNVGKADGNFGGRTDKGTRAFQADNGLRVDGVVGKWTIEKAQEYGFKTVTTFLRDVWEIIIHITAVGGATLESIINGHKAKGWKDIGYHFFIDEAGKTFEGRDIEVIGAHCAAQGMNVGTVGVAFDNRGNDKKSNAPYGEYINEKQQRALERLTAYLIQQFNLTINDVSGHNDYDDGKACPCFKVRKADVFLNNVKELLKSKVEIEIIPRHK